MEMFGFSSYEAITIIAGMLGFVWWASGMYYQLKRGADKVEEIKVDLQSMKAEFHNRTENLYRLHGDHAEELHQHAVDIARLKDKVGIEIKRGN
jgi:hypothetical protein